MTEFAYFETDFADFVAPLYSASFTSRTDKPAFLTA